MYAEMLVLNRPRLFPYTSCQHLQRFSHVFWRCKIQTLLGVSASINKLKKSINLNSNFKFMLHAHILSEPDTHTSVYIITCFLNGCCILLPDQNMWDLWQSKWQWRRVFFRELDNYHCTKAAITIAQPRRHSTHIPMNRDVLHSGGRESYFGH